MCSPEYLNMMKHINEKITNFLEDEANSEECFLILEDQFKFNNPKISDTKHDFLSLLHFICKIGNNHHRCPNFFCKIERILLIFKEDIKKSFSNSEIFNIYRSNKRILLFLIEQQIIVIDEYIVKKITKTSKYIEAKYPQYFQPEIKTFINENWFPKYSPLCSELNGNNWVRDLKKELPENFYEKRKEGENDNQICELIRKDMVTEFIAYINLNSISLNAKIQPSIYETNQFLIKNKSLSLIEYAVFLGSIQVFNYLRLEGVKLTKSLWILAIHGHNSEIIHFLEDNHVKIEDKSYKQVFHESIKCHHNDIANYFINNFLQNDEENSQDTFNQSLRYYNFIFLKKAFINKSSFFNLCKYDYSAFAADLLKNKDIDVNKKEIFAETEKTVLFLAIEKENIEIVKLLLTNDRLRINLMYKKSFTDDELSEQTALYLAVEKENIEIVKLLLKNNKLNINLGYKYISNYFRCCSILKLKIQNHIF